MLTDPGKYVFHAKRLWAAKAVRTPRQMAADNRAGHHPAIDLLVVEDAAVEAVEETSEDNGIRIAVRTIPFFKSVSFGIWINAGSRDESAEKSGLFHFLEHLLFKGTAKRSARDIATEIDALGGHIDAFTSREVTCYHGHVLRGRLDQAFELLADMTLAPAFPPEEVERERQVILEEIRMGEDDPSDYIHDQLYPVIWPGHQLDRVCRAKRGHGNR